VTKRPVAKTVIEKSKRILWGLLFAFGVIVVRVWCLAVVLHENKIQEANRPQKRTVIERAERAAIYDRCGILLATNHVQYNVGVCYGRMCHLPRQSIKRDARGKKIRCYPRKDYITALSQLLAQELGLDAARVEDEIYAKAAILGQVTYILKEDISEKTYFRLNMLEKDWPGIITELSSQRSYPYEGVGTEIIGYIGPISRQQYTATLEEMKILKEALDECPDQPELQQRLQELEKISYTINDLTGKMGVEATCDMTLRGRTGKRIYLTDIKGHCIRETEESYPPVPGEPVKLTLSIELQSYAETLLAQYSRSPPSQNATSQARRKQMPEQQPWIKEGAIVAMDPVTGEVLALASFPRFHPSDFMPCSDEKEKKKKQQRVGQWLESDVYLGSVWDHKMPLTREVWSSQKGEFEEEVYFLDWDLFLNMILPKQSSVLKSITTHNKVSDALIVQNTMDILLEVFAPLSAVKIIDLLYATDDPVGVLITLQEKDDFIAKQDDLRLSQALATLRVYFEGITTNHDKLLLVDLYRLVVDSSSFTEEIAPEFSELSLSDFRVLTTQFASVQQALKEMARGWFHERAFTLWRQEEFKTFLARKRKEERAAGKKYARPYLDYLDEEENKQFEAFWREHCLELIALFLQGGAVPPVLVPYVDVLQSTQCDIMALEQLEAIWQQDYLAFQNKILHLPSEHLFALLKTLRPFDQLKRPLYGVYPHLRQDPQTGQRLECHLATGFYRRYGYGYLRSRAFRQAATVGSLFKLIPGYAVLCQMYEKHEGRIGNPLTIVDNKHHIPGKKGGWFVGFFPDGRPIPMYYHGGRLPRSDHYGLGKLDLVKAIEVSSNPYFALLAGEVLEDPEDLCDAARLFGFGEKTGIDLIGEYQGHIPQDVSYNKTGLYAMAIGQHTLLATPLQAAVMVSAFVNGGKVLKPKIFSEDPTLCRWEIFLPEAVRRPLLEGMRHVLVGERGTARFAAAAFPADLIAQTIGKTSTAEVIDSYGCDSIASSVQNNEIWFNMVVFDPEDKGRMEKPELVVIVYLKHGEFGKHAVPYALKMAQKWREIKAKS